MSRGDYYIFARLVFALLCLYGVGIAWKRQRPGKVIDLDRYAVYGLAGLIPAFLLCHFAGEAIIKGMQEVSIGIQKFAGFRGPTTIGMILDAPPAFAMWLVMVGGISVGFAVAWARRRDFARK